MKGSLRARIKRGIQKERQISNLFFYNDKQKSHSKNANINYSINENTGEYKKNIHILQQLVVLNGQNHSSKKLGIFACACVRVCTLKKFSRARACACASFENFECACVRVRTFKFFSRARACACAFFDIFACACAHVRARARSGVLFSLFL